MEVGTELGRYKILELIGSGGMGRVYLAMDTDLDRKVALKVLLPEFVRESARVKRFLYEAKAVSAINHPGIITIHEIVNKDDRVFIATEFVEGKTLRELIEQNKTRQLRYTVSIAEQVADALSEAHRAGIVHRDIKPENIMVREDGIVKLLDFGLAKPIPSADPDSKEKKEVKTQPGLVIGSVRYMSPEQARGKDTDERTDIWSLGVVIYELLTGENPFDGESVSDQLAAVIHKEPPEAHFDNESIAEILARCLSKDVNLRYRNTKELAIELRALRLSLENSSSEAIHSSQSDPSYDTSENKTLIHQTISAENRTALMSAENEAASEYSRPKARNRSKWVGLALVAICVFFVGGLAAYYSGFMGSTDPFTDIRVREISDDGDSRAAEISPDGKLVVYASRSGGQSRLMAHQVATGTEVVLVPESKGKFGQPKFTKDGEFIYYVISSNGVGTLYRVSRLGGESRKIVEDIDSRPAVSDDGKEIVFFRHDPKDGGDKLIKVNAESRETKTITDSKKLGFDGISDVHYADSGEVAYVVGRKIDDGMRSRVNLIAVDLSSGGPVETPLTMSFKDGDWFQLMSLFTHSDDAGMLFIGKREPEDNLQVFHVATDSQVVRQVTKDTNDYESFSVSADLSRLIASRSEWNSGLTSIETANQNTNEIIPFNGRFLGKYGVATDKKGLIVFPRLDRQEINLYSLDPESGKETRLTNENGINAFPRFSDDGKKIVFSSTRGEAPGLWTMSPDGSDQKRLTTAKGMRDVNASFVDNGKRVVFVRQPVNGSTARLMIVGVNGSEPARLLPESETSDVDIYVSPDGSKIAYRAVNYEAATASLQSKVKFANLVNGKAELLEKEFDSGIEEWFTWYPDSKSLTRIGTNDSQEFSQVSFDGERQRSVLKIPYDDVLRYYWYSENKKLLLVRGYVAHDLVLIEEGSPKSVLN